MTFGAEEIVDLQPDVDNVGQVAWQDDDDDEDDDDEMNFDERDMMMIALQVPNLPAFIPITYPTGMQWSPNGEEVNLNKSRDKNFLLFIIGSKDNPAKVV